MDVRENMTLNEKSR